MWKKIIFKVLMMLIIFMGLGSYGAYLTGQPIPIFNSENLASIKAKFATIFDSAKPSNIAKTAQSVVDGEPEKLFFKWKGPDGQTHFGDRPAAGALNVEVIRGKDLSGNTVAATQMPEPEAGQPQASTDTSMPNPYSPEGVKEIMDKAKNVQKLMDERMQQQQKAMGAL